MLSTGDTVCCQITHKFKVKGQKKIHYINNNNGAGGTFYNDETINPSERYNDYKHMRLTTKHQRYGTKIEKK